MSISLIWVYFYWVVKSLYSEIFIWETFPSIKPQRKKKFLSTEWASLVSMWELWEYHHENKKYLLYLCTLLIVFLYLHINWDLCVLYLYMKFWLLCFPFHGINCISIFGPRGAYRWRGAADFMGPLGRILLPLFCAQFHFHIFVFFHHYISVCVQSYFHFWGLITNY